MTAAMADWEGLHNDLLVLILKKINLIEDFAAFMMVSKSWNAVAATNKQFLRRPQTPWLMLPVPVPVIEAEAEPQIFSLSKRDRLTKNLYIPEIPNKKCIGLNYGWLLITSLEGDVIHMNLVQPLLGAQIELPPLQTKMERCPCPAHACVNKAALSANPSESPSDFMLMIVYGCEEDLRYWRPRDKRWTKAGPMLAFSDLTYHRDRFYAIACTGSVWSWTDLGPHHQDPIVARLVAKMDWRSTTLRQVEQYVVAGSAPGSVLVLLCIRKEFKVIKESIFMRKDQDGCDVKHLKMWFQMYELDLRDGSYSEIRSLGDRAIFVGRSTSMALENASEYPGVKPNHIYFTNHSEFRCEKEVGCYNLEDGQTTHFSVDVSFSRPFWFIPSL